ncbi:HD domain-containing protein [uncultured Propionivibrio sp.]|uniref:HD domain-containing protein n=1 Tax=uncultured Propionivibrio sp. TaxID=426737 RepID=UPI0029C09066|nr:HD domain-containing protein [uncultured Propionivibrio sp.]
MTLVERVAARIESRFAGEGSGHDWHHIRRVWRLAQALAREEGANVDIAELGALVHDIADWKFHGGDESVGPREAERLLREEGASEAVIAPVVDIVATISFKGAGVATPMRSLEGACVQDADRLDALGAIGIARCFAYGGHAGRPLHDPAVPPVQHATAQAYKSAKGTSLNHFHEKLFLLKDRMNTASGRRLAEARHAYMADFVARFLQEWESDLGINECGE